MKASYLGLLMLVMLPDVAAAAAPTSAQTVPVPDEPVSIAALAEKVVIPYEMFTLPNGLQVVVRSDRSAKTVYVQVDYAVGSTSEPVGKSGFAHLFEHLMFNGSENAPDDYSVPMLKLGATINGVTQFDRTAYANVVPTPGLEPALFLESDRMGYFLGALTQRKLDEQRGVVQNEKRLQLDRPLATVRGRLGEKVYPRGHPYAHDILGSMADLDAATLADARDWFRAHYGPNNAVLSLSGDIDAAQARRLAEKYFGDIPRGPTSKRPDVPVPTLPGRLDETMTDRVAVPHLYRAWAVPGALSPDAAALQVAVGMMGDDSDTSLRHRLTEQQKLFDGLSIALELYDGAGLLYISGPLAAGVDPGAAGRALDAAIADAAAAAPSASAIERYAMREIMGSLARIASGSGNIGPVVDGLRVGRGPDWYRTRLRAMIDQTPASVQAAALTWLSRPPYALTVLPGAAPAFETAAARPADLAADAPVAKGTRGPLPPEGEYSDLDFAKPQYARLSNGIEIIYLSSAGAPLTDIRIDFDAGSVADPLNRPGTHAMLLSLMGTSTSSPTAKDIARLREKMGAEIEIGADADRTTARLSVPTANLQPGLSLLADMVRRPLLAPADVAAEADAMRADLGSGDAAEGGRFGATLAKGLDAASPYTRRSGPRDAAAIAALTPERLRAFHNAWLRPEKAAIFVVSDAPLSAVRAALEHAFGDWKAPGRPGEKPRPLAPSPAQPGILLIDRPGSDQAAIAGGQAVTGLSPRDLFAARVANDALAGDSNSRLVRDLRETRGWTYAVTGQFDVRALGMTYTVNAPVQADKAGEALGLMRRHLSDFLGAAPLTEDEFKAAIEKRIRSLPVELGGNEALLDAIRENRRLGLPDTDYADLASRYRRLTLREVRAAFRTAIDPGRFVWVVMGEAAQLRPQLESLGLPIRTAAPDMSTKE